VRFGEQIFPILEQAHAGFPGGHFSTETIAKAILNAGFWWPTLHQDAETYVKRCDDCQRAKVPIWKYDMPLRPMMGARAFTKWRIDFLGPI